MPGYGIRSSDKPGPPQNVKWEDIHTDYRSIFTYSSGPDPAPQSCKKENNAKKPMLGYSKVPQNEDAGAETSVVGQTSVFDFKSIFTYSGRSRVNGRGLSGLEAGKHVGAHPEVVSVETFYSKAVSSVVLVLSYLLVFFTLPVSVWFCFKNLPQWERIVVYRLGKLQGVKGPGNIFLIPWLDSCTKLDLRTQLITHPLKQFLTKDQAIVEAGSNTYYRICDPIRYLSNVRDPELKGLKVLANAITIKRFEASEERDFQPSRKTTIEESILKELNVIVTPWGIEISSVQIDGFRVLKEAQPVNAFMSMMEQMGISFGSDAGGAASGVCTVPTNVTLADIGLPFPREGGGRYSRNASKLQSILNTTNGTIESSVVICFNVEGDEVFYADFSQGRGQVYDSEYPGKASITLSLSQSLFDALISGASQSKFLQAYLEGQITIDGDTRALMELQKLLPNINTT